MIRNPRVWPVGAAALTLVIWTGTARADQIDQALFQHSPKLMKHLRDRGYRNVGVLKFQLQVGKEKPRFDAGRLTSLMATRLENALILANNLKVPLGVTRDAGMVAAKNNPAATWATGPGREKLFGRQYPLAWGDEKVAVDAFLTGQLRLSDDLKQTTVVIQEFTPKDPTPRPVAEFSVPTTRLLLADMNQSFCVTKRALGKTVPFKQGDDDAVADAAAERSKVKPASEARDPILDDLLDFQIVYDGAAVPRKPGPQGYTVPTPREKQQVVFKLKAKQERLGVVLLVNGINTLEGESAEALSPEQLSMWVLEPGKTYTIRGYYTLQKFNPFKVLSESESVLTDLGNPRRGKVELYVFRKAEGKALPAAIGPVSLRAVPAQPRSLKDARGQVMRAMSAKVSPRALVAPDDNGQAAPRLETVGFEGAFAGYRPIIYFQDSSSKQ